MTFFVYILFSQKINRYYVGYTSDLDKRLQEHNSGISTFTAKASDWKIMFTQQFNSREEAHKRELEIKNKKSRKYIEWLIENK
jgi:putative endonuclease